VRISELLDGVFVTQVSWAGRTSDYQYGDGAPIYLEFHEPMGASDNFLDATRD